MEGSELRGGLYPMPDALAPCGRCGELQGIYLTEVSESERGRVAVDVPCSCYGYVCSACGEGRLPRPLRERWNPSAGRLLYVSAVAGMRPCPVCGACNSWQRADEEIDGRWPRCG